MSLKFTGNTSVKCFINKLLTNLPSEDLTSEELKALWNSLNNDNPDIPDIPTEDPKVVTVGNISDLTPFTFLKDDANNTVNISAFTDTTATEVNIHGAYEIDGKQYSTKLTNCEDLFRNKSNLKSIKIGYGVDTSSVTSTKNMFQNCKALTELDTTGIDITNVTNATQMFHNCPLLTEIDVTGWNTTNLTNSQYMFNGCSSLTSIKGLNTWDTSNITNMTLMFYKCSSLTSLDLSKWDTSKVINMSALFSQCSGLTSLDISNFDTSNITTINAMFFNTGLSELDLTHFNLSKVTNASNMFKNSANLNTVKVSRNKWNISNNCNVTDMFTGCKCSSVTYVD